MTNVLPFLQTIYIFDRKKFHHNLVIEEKLIATFTIISKKYWCRSSKNFIEDTKVTVHVTCYHCKYTDSTLKMKVSPTPLQFWYFIQQLF